MKERLDRFLDRLCGFFAGIGLGRLVNRETVSYLFWGVMTSLFNIGLFWLLLRLGLRYQPANILTLIAVKLAAYLANKCFVFHTRCESFGALLSEMFRYVIARGATMLVDYFGLILLVDCVGIQPGIGKVVTTVIVVILNYILGKFGVFRDKKAATDPAAQAADGEEPAQR